MADSIDNIEPCSENSFTQEHCAKMTSMSDSVLGTKSGFNLQWSCFDLWMNLLNNNNKSL